MSPPQPQQHPQGTASAWGGPAEVCCSGLEEWRETGDHKSHSFSFATLVRLCICSLCL